MQGVRPLVSIVIATFERRQRLQGCVRAIRRHVTLPHELVIVDGGSRDGTVAWVGRQPHTRVLVEQRRAGCCAAYDLGFRAVRGEFVMWLNDDSQPLPGAIETAVEQLRRPEMSDVGLIAFYHTHRQPWNELHGYVHSGTRFGVLHVRGLPYANFGLLRSSLLEQLGYLDRGYYYCAWDPDLALKVQRDAGLKVLGVPAARVVHEELADARKTRDVNTARDRDNERLFAKWKLPPKNGFPDPRPAYAALLAARGLLAGETPTPPGETPTPPGVTSTPS